MPKESYRHNFKDETGKKYGKLLVIERVENKGGRAFWKCQCDCGKITIVKGASLRTGLKPRAGTKSCGCLAKFEYGESSFNSIFSAMKKQAIKRGHCWEITKEQAKDLFQKNCFYCGIAPYQSRSKTRANGKFFYNGLDRIDSSKGYTMENVVPCCGKCNKAKSNLTVSDFSDLITRIYNHWVIRQ